MGSIGVGTDTLPFESVKTDHRTNLVLLRRWEEQESCYASPDESIQCITTVWIVIRGERCDDDRSTRCIPPIQDTACTPIEMTLTLDPLLGKQLASFSLCKLSNSFNPLTPPYEPLPQPFNLYFTQYPRLNPRDTSRRSDLIERSTNQLQSVSDYQFRKVKREGREGTNERAFMTRCSTSNTGMLASLAMRAKGRTLSDVGRLKTASMSAIRQIFCRRNTVLSSKMLCRKHKVRGRKKRREGRGRTACETEGTMDSNFGISPALKAKSMCLIHSFSIPSSELRIGCINCESPLVVSHNLGDGRGGDNARVHQSCRCCRGELRCQDLLHEMCARSQRGPSRC